MLSLQRYLRWLIIAAMLDPVTVVAGEFDEAANDYHAGRHEQALSVFARLAATGDARAQYALGRMYEHGDGVAANPDEARNWYEKSAELGYGEAEQRLAEAYDKRATDSGDKSDRKRARQWCGRAALHGNAAAVTRLEKYAEAGDVPAQVQLGQMFYHGRGVARNVDIAFGWFSQAAAKNDAAASFALARMAERGDGRAESNADAVIGYQRAAALEQLRFFLGGPRDIRFRQQRGALAGRQCFIVREQALHHLLAFRVFRDDA